MAKHSISARARMAVAVTALAMTVAGCGSGSGSGNDGSDSGDGDSKSLVFAVNPAYTADAGVIRVLQHVLENNGYEVDLKEMTDYAPMYAGLVRGDIDQIVSWLPHTQAEPWARYGEDLEAASTYYTTCSIFLAVPDYMTDIQSIDDLNAHASEFDGEIIGIEPGAGITATTTEAIDAYGLDFEQVVSSTPAMLASVKKATDAEEPIVAAMWLPFWAMSEYGMRPLEDPKGVFGAVDKAQMVVKKTFAEDHPGPANMLEEMEPLTTEQIGSLEKAVVDAGTGNEDEAVDAWMKDNADYVASLEQALNS